MNYLFDVEPYADSSEEPPRPVQGAVYHVVFEVEHIGPNYDDEAKVTILEAPPEVATAFLYYSDSNTVPDVEHEGCTAFYPNDSTSLFYSEETPIASGRYSCDAKWFMESYKDWESGYTEIDSCGFTISNLRRISP